MPNTHSSVCANALLRQFAIDTQATNETAETIAAKAISAILHWTMRTGEAEGEDGRKIALASARRGLGDFITDVHTTPLDPPPAAYTLITVRTEGGLWVSETGYEEVIQ